VAIVESLNTLLLKTIFSLFASFSLEKNHHIITFHAFFIVFDKFLSEDVFSENIISKPITLAQASFKF
jgi:hypothetical protein